MTTAFDQWLGKPSTLRYLRHLVYPATRPSQPRIFPSGTLPHGYTKRGTSTAALKEQRYEGGNESKNIVLRARKAPDDLLDGLHAPGIASTLSLHTGEPLLAKVTNGREIFSTIKHQSDVNNPKLDGTLTVDEEEQKNNHGLWTEIVHFRRRIDGFEGVLDVWDGMRKRNCDSPNFEPESEALWTEFIQATLCGKDEETPAKLRLADDIFEHAKRVRNRTGPSGDGLYRAIVGAWMSFRPNRALEWHHKLADASFVHPGAISSVGQLAIRSGPASNAFKQIYQQSTDRDLYDSFMSEVFKTGKDDIALAWHRFFLSHGDGPGKDMSSTPEVRRLYDIENGAPMAPSVSGRSRSVTQHIPDSSKLPPISRASMNTIVGDVHGIKSREISDGFCARLLATRAFSLQVVLNGFSFLGVTAIGPLAVRELARCAGSPAAFIDAKADLKSRGIEISEYTFSQLVLKVASIGNPALWTTMLETDQHPDMFSDSALQENLLSEFLSKEQWVKAHLTLIALSLGSSSGQQLAWNRVFNHYASAGQHEALFSTMQTIRELKVPLTEFTLDNLVGSVLPPRQFGKTSSKVPGSGSFDSLSFVTNALMYGAERGSPERGSYVQYRMWIELLKRHGMEGRWHDLRKLVLWLIEWYSDGNILLQVSNHDQSSESGELIRHPLDIPRLVLNHHMVKAIFVWGFRHASRRNKLRKLNNGPRSDDSALVRPDGLVEVWASGLELLRILWERGLPINKQDVEEAFILRMWILFGPAWSTVGINNEARRLNELSLEHYVRHANEVWPGIIQAADSHLPDRATENHPELLVRLFGRARMTSKIKREFANVEAWAKELSTQGNDRVEEPYRTRAKQDLWERSKFRHKLPELAVAAPSARKIREPTAADSQATTCDAGEYQPMG